MAERPRQQDAGVRQGAEPIREEKACLSTELVLSSRTTLISAEDGGAPSIIERAGAAARFAWDEFFQGEIRNAHTRLAYGRAVRRLLEWCDTRGVGLSRITPGMVGEYFNDHPGSPATKKLHLSAVRSLFDKLVTRHAVVLNPALSVRTERYQVIEGKTPEITIEQARTLLRSLDATNVVGLRDRAVIAVMIYTAARVGAVSKLKLKHLQHDGIQWCLRFEEKGGKSREIPVRHDLERFLLEYLDSAGIRDEHKEAPLFRTAVSRTKRLTTKAMTAVDACRMVKRRLKAAGLPARLSPHSFRVTTITDLLEQGVPIDEVQYLAGHADARTTALYDRRKKRVTRNIVERISI
jgi:site-specific recombinase XerD